MTSRPRRSKKSALPCTVYTTPKLPDACVSCAKSLKAMHAGMWECSRVECPSRRRLTAQPSPNFNSESLE